MKNLARLFIMVIFSLFSCTNRQEKLPTEFDYAYNSEQEKLLNEVFLELIGSDFLYKIEQKYLDQANEALDKEGLEAGRRIYDQHKVEDTSRVILFTRDQFVSSIYKFGRFADSLNPSYLGSIHKVLIDAQFVKKDDQLIAQILDSLSFPSKLSEFKLNQTGRYEILREEDMGDVQGNYKTPGSFSCSRIYIAENKTDACLFFETNCMDGLRCAAGNLALLKKVNNRWVVAKLVPIYVT